ncbi:MAG: hypothetical protein C4576_06900 [Desulfobacteraceae bacterium]|nr:MAG: hypothetical protein C4576_06900 [Desulfobacteraceae bacterium]
MLKQTFFFSPTLVSTSSPTEIPGILDLSLMIRRLFMTVAPSVSPHGGGSQACGSKDKLQAVMESKKAGRAWQGVTGKSRVD